MDVRANTDSCSLLPDWPNLGCMSSRCVAEKNLDGAVQDRRLMSVHKVAHAPARLQRRVCLDLSTTLPKVKH